MTASKTKLFSEFPPVSDDEWKSIVKDNPKWRTPDDFEIKPYCAAQDITHKPVLRSNPGWQIREDIAIDNITAANKKALHALNNGADSIAFNGKVANAEEMAQLLNDIPIEKVSISFPCPDDAVQLLGFFINEINERNIDKSSISGYIALNAVSCWEKEGNELPYYRYINIPGQGSTVTQQLAVALVQGNKYLSQLTEKGDSIDEITPYIQFTFNIGTNYFMEIAKLRAARLLWAKIVEQYQPKNDASRNTFIHCEINPANSNKEKEAGNAFISATSRLMSAAIGGADSISISSNDDFTDRINRNIQLIAKQEAFFSQVADPAGGAYYIETLTDKIAEKAWELFKKTCLPE